MNAQAAFWAGALFMTAATLAALLPGLWRVRGPGAGAPADEGGAGIAVLREQLAGIDLELAQGRLDAALAHAQREEIARRLLQEQEGATGHWQSGPARRTALAVALAVPALALALYGGLGEPQALDQAPRTQAAAAQPTMTQVESMVSQMTQALEEKATQGQAGPEDAAAWGLAARTLASLQRFPEADKAFARALALTPDDAGLLADRADILSLLQSGSAEGEPMRLITRALRVDPGHPKALALAGSAAWARGDAALAAQHWDRALQRLNPESEFARGLAQSLAQARQKAAPAAASASLRGRVTLDPALRSRARPDDTVFIVARAVDGPRMPLAILRLRVADLPARFTLDDSSAMAPALRLSAFGQVTISARVTRSGEALAQTGDLVGAPLNVRVGAQDLDLRIDRVQP